MQSQRGCPRRGGRLQVLGPLHTARRHAHLCVALVVPSALCHPACGCPTAPPPSPSLLAAIRVCCTHELMKYSTLRGICGTASLLWMVSRVCVGSPGCDHSGYAVTLELEAARALTSFSFLFHTRLLRKTWD